MNSKTSFRRLPHSAFRLLAHLHPHIRISPFISQEWRRLLADTPKTEIDIANLPSFWLSGAKDLRYFDSGRAALSACLKFLRLKSFDEVLIETTTGGAYISSCVRNTIEETCRWSRIFSTRTKLILVIHEFGFPYPRPKMDKLRKMNIPIMEDCAHSFGTRVEGNAVGEDGHFAIYSLTKYFPIPFGGCLLAKEKLDSRIQCTALSYAQQNLMKRTVNNSIPHFHSWNEIRRDNWRWFARNLKFHGHDPYFNLPRGVVPGVFVTKGPGSFAGERVKINLSQAGIESTQYYHMGGFYFPVHQFLTDFEKEYILRYYLGI